jgi:hypothetical protein
VSVTADDGAGAMRMSVPSMATLVGAPLVRTGRVIQPEDARGLEDQVALGHYAAS